MIETQYSDDLRCIHIRVKLSLYYPDNNALNSVVDNRKPMDLPAKRCGIRMVYESGLENFEEFPAEDCVGIVSSVEKIYELLEPGSNDTRFIGIWVMGGVDDLRFLKWDGYPSNSLPSTFQAIKLFEINLYLSKIKYLWKGLKTFEKLKNIKLSYSHNLIETPDFTRVPYLETLNLEGCSRLRELHKSSLSEEFGS
ncbi:hypothetical protein QYF36_018375 [Acer negundo]|nr:hypothetical protein QYF36_018375 [Acer negundo]